MVLELGELVIDELDVKAVEGDSLGKALDGVALDEVGIDEAALVEIEDSALVLDEVDGILDAIVLELEELDSVKLVVEAVVDDKNDVLESA